MLLDGADIVHRFDSRAASSRLKVGIIDKPGLANGVLSINYKGSGGAFASGTAFVCARPDNEIRQWRESRGLGGDPARPFAGQAIVVEDASPDTCLSLVALALRLQGRTLSDEWIAYASLWEMGGTEAMGAPAESFGALESALVHVELQGASASGGLEASRAYARALRIGVEYAHGLIDLGCDPTALPRSLSKAPARLRNLHGLAHARLAFEETIYKRIAASAQRLQLTIDLAESNDRLAEQERPPADAKRHEPSGAGKAAGSERKALVDAILFSEATITSSLKVFVRSDRTTFTGQGYAFMGLYRPEARGSGNDIALSTNPAAHLSLKALWLELERLEEEKWTAFAASAGGFPRPRDPSGATNRVLVSHRLAGCPVPPCIEPWWDDNGRLTLIGAPRTVDHKGARVFGSLLTWADVKAAIWRCYAPTMGLRLRPRGSGGPGLPLTETGADLAALRSALHAAGPAELHVVDVERVHDDDGQRGPGAEAKRPATDRHENEVVLWSPTLSAACAAFLDTGLATIDNLPPPSAYDMIEERGGVIVVTEHGAMLIAMSQAAQFPADALRKSAEDVAATVGCAAELEEAIRGSIRALVEDAINAGGGGGKRAALKAIYAAKLRARKAWDQARRAETDHLVRRFRALCEQRWQARSRLDAALAEIDELEAMVVSSTAASPASARGKSHEGCKRAW